MKRMETVPRELNLVKKVADFRLIRGNTIRTRKRGTYQKMMTKNNNHEDDYDDDEVHRGELAPD